jgi:hypothetical protein
MWETDDGFRFRTANERGETVIDAGHFAHASA